MDHNQRPCLSMDEKHRQQILKNTESLVDCTDYKVLVNACLNDKLLSRAMYNKIEALPGYDGKDPQRERHRRLFIKITKRGPDAFKRLKSILVSLECLDAMKLLTFDINDENYQSMHQGPNVPPSTQVVSRPIPKIAINAHSTLADGACISRNDDDQVDKNEDLILKPYDKEIKPKRTHEVVKSSHIHFDNKVGVYPMKSQHKRGVFLMINIINFVDDYREGAKEDSESLLHLFKSLGFTLFAFENLTSDNFIKTITKVINSEYTRDAECFVMALMSHGDMDDDNRVEKVELSDGSMIQVEQILSCFYNNACVNLKNKPKIFLFPFCRGKNFDVPYMARKLQTDGARMNAEPNHNNRPHTQREQRVADILICYATLQGFKAHRDPVDGTWYIQCFCENMAKHAHDTHFENILKMTHNDTGKIRSPSGAMQTANYNNLAFNKKLYFNPGVFEEMETSG